MDKDTPTRREGNTLASREWLRLAAESACELAIVTMDGEGKVTGWNAGAERSFGYTSTEMLGKPVDILYTLEEIGQGVPQEERRRARATGRVKDGRWHVCKDGGRVFFEIVTTPLDNGPICGFTRIALEQAGRADGEGLHAHGSQLGHAQEELAGAMRDEFLAVMSHELRHPLNLISINAELLLRLPEVDKSAPATRAASVIRHAVVSQAKIIEDLLDISRLDTGKLTLVREDVDLGDIAARLVDVLKSDPLVDSLRLQFVRPAQALMVSADAVRMEQVVLNLLNNAVKFTPSSGTIALALSAEEGEARLDVSDTGAGIEPRFLPRIFDMFGQGGATAVRSKTGLGIGLALVRHIVELHGGRVEAGSEGVGHGSRFSIWLPLVPCAGCCKDKQESASGSSLAGRRILLVDDMEDSVYMFRTLLEMEGATVLVATTGQEGLAILGRETVDVVISDISMPDMDGYAFMRAVRTQPALANLPAIAASGLGREKDVQRALDAGYTCHLTKPIDIEVLCRKINEHLPA